MTSHVLSNVVYLKNISPLLSDVQLLEFLRPALAKSGVGDDDVMRVEFKQFPGSAQRYCQVDFKSSSGVTAATSLNGQTLLGVPIVITVIDPSTSSSSSSASALSQSGILAGLHGGSFQGMSQMNLFQGVQGDIQLAAMQAAALALQQGRTATATVTPYLSSSYLINPLAPTSPKETEAQVISRTIQIEGLPDDWGTVNQVSNYLCAMAKQLGYGEIIVTDQKIITVASSPRIALLEFKTLDMAEKIKKLPNQYLTINKAVLRLSRAKSTVTLRDPDNVSFDPPPSAPVPVAYQQLTKLKLAEKIARARALAVRISSSTSEPIKPVIASETPLPTNLGSQVPSDITGTQPARRRHVPVVAVESSGRDLRLTSPNRSMHSRRKKEYTDNRREHDYNDNRREHDYNDNRREHDYNEGRREHDYNEGRREHDYKDNRRDHEYNEGRRNHDYKDNRRDHEYNDRRREHEYVRDREREMSRRELDRIRHEEDGRRKRRTRPSVSPPVVHKKDSTRGDPTCGEDEGRLRRGRDEEMDEGRLRRGRDEEMDEYDRRKRRMTDEPRRQKRRAERSEEPMRRGVSRKHEDETALVRSDSHHKPADGRRDHHQSSDKNEDRLNGVTCKNGDKKEDDNNQEDGKSQENDKTLEDDKSRENGKIQEDDKSQEDDEVEVAKMRELKEQVRRTLKKFSN